MVATEIPVTLRDKYSGIRHSSTLTLIDCDDTLSLIVPRICCTMAGKFDRIKTDSHFLQGILVPLYRHTLINRLYRVEMVTGIGQLVFDIREEIPWSDGMEYA